MVMSWLNDRKQNVVNDYLPLLYHVTVTMGYFKMVLFLHTWCCLIQQKLNGTLLIVIILQANECLLRYRLV